MIVSTFYQKALREKFGEELTSEIVAILARSTPEAMRQQRCRARKAAISCDMSRDQTRDQTRDRGAIGGSFFLTSPQEPLKKDLDSGCAREREFFDAYNVCARERGWTVAKKLDQRRRVSIRKRIEEAGGLEKAFDFLNSFADSKHGSVYGAGHNENGWTVGIDYVIRASKWLEIMEGKFNGVQTTGQRPTNGHRNGADIFRTSSGQVF